MLLGFIKVQCAMARRQTAKPVAAAELWINASCHLSCYALCACAGAFRVAKSAAAEHITRLMAPLKLGTDVSADISEIISNYTAMQLVLVRSSQACTAHAS
jgi:hypothetical protein